MKYDDFNKILKISGPRILFDFSVAFEIDHEDNDEFNQNEQNIPSKKNVMILKYKDVLNLTCRKVILLYAYKLFSSKLIQIILKILGTQR